MKIYHTLHQHQTQVQDRVHKDQQSGRETSSNMTRCRKTVSSAQWVQMVFLVCYAPYLVVAIYFIAEIRYTALPFIWQVAFVTRAVKLMSQSMSLLLKDQGREVSMQ